jgi:glycosyltransferase involved in cell wall biosynthesis
MKQKLVFFLGGKEFSGAEKRIFLTALHISKFNVFEVVIFIEKDLFNSINKHDKFLGCDLATLKIVRHQTFSNLPVLKLLSIPLKYFTRIAYVSFYKPRFVHFTLYNFIDLYLARFVKLFGGKVLFEITSPDVALGNVTKNILINPKVCDLIICVSQNVKKLCLEKFSGCEPRVVTRKYPFVDFERNENIFAAKKNQVLFAHRLIKRKNPLIALEAFINLAKKFPDWIFLLCGRGNLEKEVEYRVAKAGLPNLCFKGYELNMSARLQESKIFVSLIEPDNYPSQSVIEALASGCVLLVSESGQSKEKFISKQFINGYTVVLNSDSVQNKIESMIKSDELEQISGNSVKHFRENFSLGAYLSESISFYEMEFKFEVQ